MVGLTTRAMLMVVAVAVLLAAWTGTANGDFLAEYLKDKTFGKDPGPCPNDANPCVGDFANLPPSILNTQVCLNEGQTFACRRLGDWVEGGTYRIFELKCEDVSIDSARVGSAEITTPVFGANEAVLSTLRVSGLRQRCNFKVDTTDLIITLAGVKITSSIRDGFFSFDQTQADDGTTINPVAVFFLWSSAGATIANAVPDQIRIPFAFCDIDPSLGLSVDLDSNEFYDLEICFGALGCARQSNIIWGLIFRLIPWGSFIQLLGNLFEGAIGGVICSALEQSALDPLTSDVGIINEVWKDFKDEIDRVGELEGDDVDLEDTDAGQLDRYADRVISGNPVPLEQAELDNALNLANSTTAELVSVSLNNFLGSDSTTTPGRLVVNEVVDLLTEPDGFFLSGSDLGLVVEEEAFVSKVFVRLDEFQVFGLNTFDVFNVLQNGYDDPNRDAFDAYKRTFDNTVSLATLGIQFQAYVNLCAGEWVTRDCRDLGTCAPNPDECSDFTFTYSMELKNVDLEAAVTIVFDDDEYNNLKMGQLAAFERFGDDVDQIYFWFRSCFAAGFKSARVTSLTGAVAEIQEPTLIGFGGDGLNALAEDTVELVSSLVKGALQTKFDGLLQGPVREYINNETRDNVVARGYIRGVEDCPSWFYPVSDPEVVDIDFNEGYANYVYPIINDALGGDPIVDTDSDINELIDVLLKFYELKNPSFPLDSWDNVTDPAVQFEQGRWELKDDVMESASVPAFNEPARFISFTDMYIDNVNSLYKLAATPVEQSENIDKGVKIKFGLGGQLRDRNPVNGLLPESPVELGFTFTVADRATTEVWDFTLKLEEFDFEFITNNVVVNLFRFLELKYEDSGHVPCYLMALDTILFPEDSRISTLKKLDFELDQVSGPGTSPLGLALLQFQANPSTPGQTFDIAQITTRRFKGLVNSFADGLLQFVLDEVEDIPDAYAERRVTFSNCISEPDPFEDIIGLASVAGDVNLTGLSDECLADVVRPVLASQVYEANLVVGYDESAGDEVFDWFASDLLTLFQEFILDDTDVVNRLLIDLANATDKNSINKYLVLDETLGPSDLRVDLNFPLKDLDLFFESDTVLPGLVADAGVLNIKGINRFARSSSNDFDIAKPDKDAPMSLTHRFEFAETNPLEMRIDAFVDIPCKLANETEGDCAGNPDFLLREDVELVWQIEGLDIGLLTILAVDENLFGDLALGNLFSVDENQTLSLADGWDLCLFSTVFEGGVVVPWINLEVKEMVGPTLSFPNKNFVSVGMENVLVAITDILKDFYIDALPNIADNCGRRILNDFLAEQWALAQVEGACPAEIAEVPLQGDDVFYRFNEADDWAFVQELLGPEYLAENNYQVFNDVVGSLGKEIGFLPAGTADEFRFEDLPLIYNGFTYGSAGIALANLFIRPTTNGGTGLDDPNTGLGTFTNIRVLEPFFAVGQAASDGADNRRSLVEVNASDPNLVVANLPFQTITEIEAAGPMVLEFDLDFNSTDVFPEIPNMVNQFTLSLAFSQPYLRLQLLAKMNVTKALNVRFSSISDADELPCLFVPFAELEPQKFNFTLQNLELSIKCRGTCDLLPQLEAGPALDVVDEQFTVLFNDFIEFAVAYVDGRGAQVGIDAFLSQSEEQCGRVLGLIDDLLTPPDSTAKDIASLLGLIFLGGAGLSGIMASSLFPTHKKRRQRAMNKALGYYKDITSEQELAGIMAMTELKMRSTFAHPFTPAAAKFIIPTMCIFNIIGLVIAIVFSDAANIVIIFTVLGNDTRLINLVPFTIISTINDIWNSGAWPLSILIAVASCAWPVIKNSLLLCFWFMPKTIMKSKKQRHYLEILDLAGKWSFLDVYVIVIMLAALRTYVRASYFPFATGGLVSDDFFVADVTVTPERGIIMLCFVAANSLVTNHLVIFFHDRVDKSNSDSEDKISGNYTGKVPVRAAVKRRIAAHVFVGKDSNSMVRRVSRKGVVAISIVSALAIGFVVLGSTLPLVTFEFDGLVGILLEYISTSGADFESALDIKTYSIVGMGTALSSAPSSGPGDAIILIFFQTLYFITVLIAPLTSIALSLMLLFMPLNLPSSRSFHFFTKLAFYWSAVEVLLVGIVATIIEIGPVTSYIVDFITDDVCSYSKAAITVLVPDKKDAFCLNVIGSFEPTAAVLAFGVICQLLAYWMTTVIGRAVMDDRYFAAYVSLRNDVKPQRLSSLQRATIRLLTNTFHADDEGMAGYSAFYNLDPGEHQAQVALAPTTTGRVCDWCCSTSKGETAADARIAAWQNKFGVKRVSSGNPTFESPVADAKTAYPSTSARVRSTSEDSVEV